MNTTRMPAFTAEASLSSTSGHYKVERVLAGLRQGDVHHVLPALKREPTYGCGCGYKECCCAWPGGHYCWFKEPL
jgi:hypothetical protein